jgi:hypothetical protein
MLSTIIENHLQETGGRKAIEGIKSLQVDFHLIEPSFEAEGTYRADRSGRMRVDIFINGSRVFTEGLVDAHGWQLPQNAEHGTPSSATGSLVLMRGVENQILGLHELGVRGHRLELVGQETVDGIEYHVINVIYTDGHMIWRYINSATWLIERSRELKALHPDLDATESIMETRFTDFRNVGEGIMRPFHETQVDLSTGKLVQNTLVKQILVNPVIDYGLYECP